MLIRRAYSWVGDVWLLLSTTAEGAAAAEVAADVPPLPLLVDGC